jgi:hypothetical protein
VAHQADYAYSAFGAGAGSRLFEVTQLGFDSKPIERLTVDQMDKRLTTWRWAGEGEPSCWIPWGEQKIKLWRTPSGTDSIYIEGFEVADPANFNADNHIPAIHVTDHELLAAEAALIVLPRMAADEPRGTAARAQILREKVDKGYAAARKRIHGTGGQTIIFGRNSDLTTGDDSMVLSETVVNIV